MAAGWIFLAVFVLVLIGYVALIVREGPKSPPISGNKRSHDPRMMPGHTQGSVPGPWGGGISGGGGDGL